MGDTGYYVDAIYAIACEKADEFESWGMVPTARAALIRAFKELADEILSWKSPALFPKFGLPVLVRLRSGVEYEDDIYAVGKFSNNKGWVDMYDEAFPDTFQIEGWRYIYE